MPGLRGMSSLDKNVALRQLPTIAEAPSCEYE
jgi:hypothetical protein